MEATNEELKQAENRLVIEWKSFVYTFLSGFLIVVLATIDDFSLTTIKSGAWVGVIGGAVRAGLKLALPVVIEGLEKLSKMWNNKRG